MDKEFEIIEYRSLKHINIFVNDILYRNVHFHNEFEIILILDGTGTITVNNQPFSAEKDDIFVINPNENHEFETHGSHLLCLITQISGRFLKDYVPEIGNLRFSSGRLNGKDEELKKAIFQTADCFMKREDLYRMKTIAAVIQILNTLTERIPYTVGKEASSDSVRITRMRRWRDYIEKHCAEPIGLEDLEKGGSLSVTYISHLFREYFGISFQEYLNNIRFEKAMGLVNSTEMSVYDLALASGFSDAKYLNREFRRHLGCSVKEYRKSQIPELRRQNTERGQNEYRYPAADARELLESIRMQS